MRTKGADNMTCRASVGQVAASEFIILVAGQVQSDDVVNTIFYVVGSSGAGECTERVYFNGHLDCEKIETSWD